MTPLKDSLSIKVVESVEDGILALDGDGLVTIFNPASQTLFGISERQAVGKSFATVIHREENLLALVESSWQSGRTISRHEDITREPDPAGLQFAAGPAKRNTPGQHGSANPPRR